MNSVDWAALPDGFLQGVSADPSARFVCRSWGRVLALGVSKLSVHGLPPREGIFSVFACVRELEWSCAYREPLLNAGPSFVHVHSLVLHHCDDDVLLEICSGVHLPCLTLLDVSWSEDLTKKGLREMRQLAGLKSLNLKGCERIRDASSLSNPALTYLHMGALKRLSNTAFVRNLPSLTFLDFTYCDNVACVAGISSLRSLELLRLKGTAVRKVAPPLSLTSLDLSDCKKLVSLGGLGRLSALTSLDLDNSRLEDAMLLEICEQLGTHGALQHLSCATHSMTCITDAALQGIGRIRSLTSLVLERNYRITDAGMAHVGRLSRLTSLDLWQCSRITDEGLAELGTLESLTSLNVRLTAVTSLQCLGHLTALTVISNLTM